MIQGIFASNQGIVGDRVGDFSSTILRLNPSGTALFLALSSGMENAPAGDTVFNWFEESHQGGRTSAVSGTTSTTVVVADGSYYVPGAVLLCEETGELMLVTATNGDSLTVTRGLGGTTVTSVGTNHIQQVGNAHEEGSTMPTAVAQQGTVRLNYVQIFRNSWAITGTAKAVQFRTGNKLAKNKRDCATFHAEDMERAFMWGRKHIGTLNTKQFRMTDGVLAQIENYGGTVSVANSGSTSGALSLEDLEEFIRLVFKLNIKGQPNERICFCGDIVLKVIQKLVRLNSEYNITQGESKVGIKVTEIVTVFGTLRLMTHPLMNENGTWAKELYVLHPGAIRKRTLRNTFDENYDRDGLRASGVDADQGLITTEVGVEVAAPRTMGIYKAIATAKADAA